MGYETRFRLHGELDGKFKCKYKVTHEDIENKKQVLIAMCMLKNEKNSSMWDLFSIQEKISKCLRLLINDISEEWKTNIAYRLEETEYTEKNEINFCGWNYSEKGNNGWTEEELYDYFSKNLFMLAIHEVEPPFANNDKINEEYYNKLQKVEEYVNDISDCVYDMWDNLFIERYRNSEDADESDGYGHKYPEELNQNTEKILEE